MFSVSFLADVFIRNSDKPLKAAYSDQPIRPSFYIRSNAFSTPSSTPQTPPSWPPRHDSTGLRPTCVAGHVVSFQACSPSTPLKDRVVTHVVRSGTSSLMLPMAMSEGGGGDCGFWKERAFTVKAWACILQTPVIPNETRLISNACRLISSGGSIRLESFRINL